MRNIILIKFNLLVKLSRNLKAKFTIRKWIIGKFRNIKHVIVERNHIDEFNYYKNIFDFFKKKIIKFLMIILYKKADLVIGNAKNLSKDLSKITKAKGGGTKRDPCDKGVSDYPLSLPWAWGTSVPEVHDEEWECWLFSRVSCLHRRNETQNIDGN